MLCTNYSFFFPQHIVRAIEIYNLWSLHQVAGLVVMFEEPVQYTRCEAMFWNQLFLYWFYWDGEFSCQLVSLQRIPWESYLARLCSLLPLVLKDMIYLVTGVGLVFYGVLTYFWVTFLFQAICRYSECNRGQFCVGGGVCLPAYPVRYIIARFFFCLRHPDRDYLCLRWKSKLLRYDVTPVQKAGDRVVGRHANVHQFGCRCF